MGLLKFDFNKANAQIQELEEIASEIDQLADTDYENLMQQMRSAWKGNAADAYIRKASYFFRSSTLSSFSHGRSRSFLPKWP